MRTIKPTKTPRSRPLVPAASSRAGGVRGARGIGAGTIAAALVLACGGGSGPNGVPPQAQPPELPPQPEVAPSEPVAPAASDAGPQSAPPSTKKP